MLTQIKSSTLPAVADFAGRSRLFGPAPSFVRHSTPFRSVARNDSAGEAEICSRFEMASVPPAAVIARRRARYPCSRCVDGVIAAVWQGCREDSQHAIAAKTQETV